MIVTSNGISGVDNIKAKVAEIKKKVNIPMYFYNIIVPQLGSYYDTYPVNFDVKIVVCCPLHDEDTPSMRYYEETNSFYCFGCQKGGDVIALHRYFTERMNGTKPSYEEAVIFIYNYFIKGREATAIIPSTITEKKEEKSTDVEMVHFNLYRVNLEKSITSDHKLKQEIKEKLWEYLDMIDCLISKEIIGAVDAENSLKAKVKELVTADAYNIQMQPR